MAFLILMLFSSSILGYRIVSGDCNCSNKCPGSPYDETVPTRTTAFRQNILERCNIAKDASNPFENEFQPTPVQIYFTVDRFIEIDDVIGTMTLLGALTMVWQVPCVAAVARQLGFSTSGSFITLNETIYWQPPIGHRNARQDMMMSEHFRRMLMLQPNMGLFRFTIVGIFETACELSLGEFPFDNQECSLVFSSLINVEQLQISNQSYITTIDTAFPAASIWRLDGTSTNVMQPAFQQFRFQEVHFALQIHRSPRYYMTALMLTNTMFTLLICFTVLLPPGTSKRSQFSIAINLAYVLQHAQVLEMIPHTSQQVFLTTYLMTQIVYAMVVTVYSVAMACLADSFPVQAERRIKLGVFLGKVRHMTAIRFVDTLSFSFLFIVLWALQIKPSILLWTHIDALLGQ